MNFWNKEHGAKGCNKMREQNYRARFITYTFGHVVWNRTWLSADAFLNSTWYL